MTLTLSPLEAISRTKTRDTLKTNVFLWGGRIAPWYGDEHKRTGSLEPEVVLSPSTLICSFRHSLFPWKQTFFKLPERLAVSHPAVPGGNAVVFSFRSLWRQRFLFLHPDTHQRHSAYASKRKGQGKAVLWAELLHAMVSHTLIKILNTCENI